MLAESHFLCRDEAWLGRRRSTRRPGGFGPLSPLGLHSAWISFCIFVCFLCCLEIFHSSPRPSCFLTFYLSGFSAHEKLRHWTRPLVFWQAVTRYFPLTSNNWLLFFPWLESVYRSRCFSRAETVARWDVADLLTHRPDNPSSSLLSCSHIYFQNIITCEILLFGRCFPHSLQARVCGWLCVVAAAWFLALWARWQDSPDGVIFHLLLFFLTFFLLQLPLTAVMVTDEAN